MKSFLYLFFALLFFSACGSASFTGSKGSSKSGQNNPPPIVCNDGDQSDDCKGDEEPTPDPDCEIDPFAEGCEDDPKDDDDDKNDDDKKDDDDKKHHDDCPSQNDPSQNDDWSKDNPSQNGDWDKDDDCDSKK